MTSTNYDLIIVGCGPIGLATAFYAATQSKEANKILVIEKQSEAVLFNNDYIGSSGDLTRMLRTMYTEDHYARLAKECLGDWANMEHQLGLGTEALRLKSGLLNFGQAELGSGSPEGTLLEPTMNLQNYQMAYSYLPNGKSIEQFAPIFTNLDPTYQGVFAPDNYCINVPALRQQLIQGCKNKKVEFWFGTAVSKVSDTNGVVTVEISTDEKTAAINVKNVVNEKKNNGGNKNGNNNNNAKASQNNKKITQVTTKKCALTLNAFTPKLLEDSFQIKLVLTIWKMKWAYFNTVNDTPASHVLKTMWFQFEEDKFFYGFPNLPWDPKNLKHPGSIRVALDAPTETVDDMNNIPNDTANDLVEVKEFVKQYMNGVDPEPIDSGNCYQSNLFDNGFILDFVKKSDGTVVSNNIVVCCCGWAMKFVPLFGRIINTLLWKDTNKVGYTNWSKLYGQYFDMAREGNHQTGTKLLSEFKFKKFSHPFSHLRTAVRTKNGKDNQNGQENVPKYRFNRL